MRRTLVVLGVALSLVGCKKHPETETLLIAGSSTVRGYLEPVVKAFVAKNPNVNVVSEGGGGTAGLVALKHGAIDIATVARPVTNAEDDVYLRDYLVARDGVAIIVSKANPVGDVSKHKLAKIFEGELTKWSDVDAEHGQGDIVVVERDSKSHVRKSLEDLIMPGQDPVHPGRLAASAAEMIELVKSTPGAIGYLSLHKMTDDVKALKIDGVEMSRPTMLSGRYPLSRSFYLAVHMNGTPMADKFIEFTLGKDGQTILADDGLLATY